jgi:hypothetical protein
MDDADAFARLKVRIVCQIEQRQAELLPFRASVLSMEKAGYDSTAARYVLECMENELARWRDIEQEINVFEIPVVVYARVTRT